MCVIINYTKLKGIDKMGKRKFVAILDTETCMGKGQKLFDIGLLIGDLHGNIVYQRQWIIAETFLTEKLFYEFKRELYTSRLIHGSGYPSYFVTVEQAFNDMKKALEQFKVQEIYAYNMAFDSRVIKQRAEIENLPNPLQNYNLECLWFWATQTIFQQKNFKKFAKKYSNFHMTEKGNYKTSAETCFAYMKQEPEFIEEHTALEDCKIEYEIFLKCKKQNKKRAKGIASNVWLLAQEEKQIQKLPPQFRTMKINLDNQIEQITEIAKRYNKQINIKVDLEIK